MRPPRKHSLIIAGLCCALAGFLATFLDGCADTPISDELTVVTLRPGETWDGVHGLCKFGWLEHNKGLIVYGRVHDTELSPYGMSTFQVMLAKVKESTFGIFTPDGATIIDGDDEGASKDNPLRGWIKVIVPRSRMVQKNRDIKPDETWIGI